MGPSRELVPDRFGDLIDLGVRVIGRGELGGSWNRFTPCDPTLLLNCNPGVFPLLRPEVQLGIQVGGTISERFHIDVDYDQRREFDAANRINIYYQGLPGEVLQRLELGDVSIRFPSSRYLTAGVPGGNFGFKATGRVGPLDLQTIWAQQKGEVSRREFRLSGQSGSEGLVQEASITLDDADYVSGQFFFLLDPESLAGYPQIDVLALRPDQAPADQRPARGGEVHLYRDERPSLISPEQRAQLGYFLAEGVTADGEARHRGQFRRLVPGEDYLLHPSGLWVMLRVPLRQDEALAAAYVTETGATIGTPAAETLPIGSTPELLLLRGPGAIHQPGSASWRFEMHQIYRIDGSTEVDPASVELTISLGERAGGVTFRHIDGSPLSFLKLFGLDEDLPGDRVDEGRLFYPARAAGGLTGGVMETGVDAMGGGPRFGGTFLVFPTLRPFADPPSVPSMRLSAEEVALALGQDLNPEIYDAPDPIRRESSARFRLDFSYRLALDGVVSSFGLGAFGIREGSETLTLGTRTLVRGVDYSIDYDLGQVTLHDAQGLFAAHPGAELRAVWEQRAIFQAAPRTLLGFSAHTPLGERGNLNLVGLYQSERAIQARPQLGLEPGTNLLGGANGDVELDAGWLDNLLGGLAGGNGQGSRIRLAGELAVSLPNPNHRGATYLDDFEAGDDVPLSLEQRLWRLGSRPDDRTGANELLPDPLDPTTAATLIWQHELLDDAGRVTGPRLARDIDRQIQLAGVHRTEPVLYLTFGNGEAPAQERRWRSVTTVLSTTGRDMSRSEYLEFYAAAPAGRDLALIVDIGTVSEDAFYFDSEGRTEGEYPDGRRWGLGILDEEARLGEGEIWSARSDSLGLWNQPCLAEPGRRAYRAGDSRANCTRGNGEIDTEDLDGNGLLDARDGAIFRYIVRLDPSSPYLVRDRNATGTEFSLYRIPLRGPGGIALNGANEGSWRYVKHLRLTITGSPGRANVPDIALARVRIVGSRWTKRDLDGIRAGLTDDRPGSGAGRTELQVGSVSRITDGADYVSPPGVGDQVQDPTAVYGSSGVEYNEKSLRLAYRDLEPGDRAEVYFRYPQQPRNLLAYRELRLWALARAGRWGPTGGERLVVGLGTDSRNRYLYRTDLRVTPAGASPTAEAWLPELAIAFEHWFELKARAEEALLAGEVGDGSGPLVLWSEDSIYGIVVEDRARAPNLAAIREISFAVYNSGIVPVTGEVWLDDLRLGGAVRDAGVAGHWEVGVVAGDFASAAVSYGSRGGLFRQLDGEATYQTSRDLGVSGTAQLGKLAPESWGLELPLTVSHTRTGHDPTFLERTDLRADRLEGVRRTGGDQTRVSLVVRRADPVEGSWFGALLNGAQLRLGYHTARSHSLTSREERRGVDVGVGYAERPAAKEIDPIPGPVEAALRLLLPQSLEETELVRRLTSARFRWTPTEIVVSTAYDNRLLRSYRFSGPVRGPEDAEVRAIEAPRRGLESLARINFQPFHSLTAGLTFTSDRDLLPPERAQVQPLVRRALGEARAEVAGLDLGWERQRTLESRVDFRPMITPWLRPGIGYLARFRGDRNTLYWERVIVADDTTAILQRHYQSDRVFTRSVAFDPELLGRELERPGPNDPGELTRAFAALLRTLRPVDLTWTDGADSRYERERYGPGAWYHFGLWGHPEPGAGEDWGLGGQGIAAAARARRSFRARGGIGLPLRVQLDLTYQESGSDAFEAGGGRYLYMERSWPDLAVSWSDIPTPPLLRTLVSHSTASVGYRRATNSGRIGAVGGTLRSGEETSIPLRLAVGLANGLSGSYTGLLGEGWVSDPTGATEQEVAQHSVQVAGAFRLPESWGEGSPPPLRVALSLSTHTRQQCRVSAAAGEDGGSGECVPFIDMVTRQLGLTVETIVSQLNVGFQMSYNDRKSFVGLRSGSSQFQLGLFGEFNFEAGNFARGVR